jgi:hypothetical protein
MLHLSLPGSCLAVLEKAGLVLEVNGGVYPGKAPLDEMSVEKGAVGKIDIGPPAGAFISRAGIVFVQPGIPAIQA